MAPRVLYFGSRQILWECKELEAYEVFPEGIPALMRSGFKSAGLLEGPSRIHGVKLQVRQLDADNDAKGKLKEDLEANITSGVEDILIREERDKDEKNRWRV